MMVAGWMFGEGIAGMTEASTTLRPSMPHMRVDARKHSRIAP
jgi:hypothetical protein